MSYTTGIAVGMAMNNSHSSGESDVNVLYAFAISVELVFVLTYLCRIIMFYMNKPKHSTFFEYVFWESMESSEIISGFFIGINAMFVFIYIVSVIYNLLT